MPTWPDWHHLPGNIPASQPWPTSVTNDEVLIVNGPARERMLSIPSHTAVFETTVVDNTTRVRPPAPKEYHCPKCKTKLPSRPEDTPQADPYQLVRCAYSVHRYHAAPETLRQLGLPACTTLIINIGIVQGTTVPDGEIQELILSRLAIPPLVEIDVVDVRPLPDGHWHEPTVDTRPPRRWHPS